MIHAKSIYLDVQISLNIICHGCIWIALPGLIQTSHKVRCIADVSKTKRKKSKAKKQTTPFLEYAEPKLLVSV